MNCQCFKGKFKFSTMLPRLPYSKMTMTVGLYLSKLYQYTLRTLAASFTLFNVFTFIKDIFGSYVRLFLELCWTIPNALPRSIKHTWARNDLYEREAILRFYFIYIYSCRICCSLIGMIFFPPKSVQSLIDCHNLCT